MEATVDKPVIVHETKYCTSCGLVMKKPKGLSWNRFMLRKYCGMKCAKGKQGLATHVQTTDGKDDMPVAHYIGKNSRNGRLMADYNLGLLKVVEKITDAKVKNSEAGNNGKGIICTYKGIPVTPDMVKTANQWLMDNWIGKASQRNPEPEKDDRTEEQKMDELRYTVKELGYEMVKIGSGA